MTLSNKYLLSVAIWILVLLATSCKKDKQTTDDEKREIKTDVYIAGYESNGTRNMAKLWKNGESINITDGTKDASALSVVVSGDDVFVAGYESNGNKRVAKVWKNGVATLLTDGSNDAVVYTLFVSGKEIYAGGYEQNGSSHIPIIWKNGQVLFRMEQSATNFGSFITSLYVSGNDVYASGAVYNSSSSSFPTVWKNGEELYTLSNESSYRARANAISIQNGNIYVAGSLDYKACIWKNGTPVYISTLYGIAQSIFVTPDNDVYYSGFEELGGNSYIGVAKIWKNGAPTILTDGGQNANAYAIWVAGTDIYAAGFESNGSKAVAKLWKNGKATALSNGNETATAQSIFINQTSM